VSVVSLLLFLEAVLFDCDPVFFAFLTEAVLACLDHSKFWPLFVFIDQTQD